MLLQLLRELTGNMLLCSARNHSILMRMRVVWEVINCKRLTSRPVHRASAPEARPAARETYEDAEDGLGSRSMSLEEVSLKTLAPGSKDLDSAALRAHLRGASERHNGNSIIITPLRENEEGVLGALSAPCMSPLQRYTPLPEDYSPNIGASAGLFAKPNVSYAAAPASCHETLEQILSTASMQIRWHAMTCPCLHRHPGG